MVKTVDESNSPKKNSPGSILLLYHFFYPDDVVSARHFSDLAAGLAERGWAVTVLTSNRFCRQPKARIDESEETWQGVRIRRVYRPAFRQSSNIGRLLNSFCLLIQWLGFIIKQPAYDKVVLGTDPQFGYLILPLIRLFKRSSKLYHWVFDLYPDAIEADGTGISAKLARLVRPVASFCYAYVDVMVDIGPCMRQRLDAYGHHATRATLVPWALSEPDEPLESDPEERKRLFGEARLTLLYSGTIGKAHQFETFVKLARELRRRNADIAFCFAGRGNRYNELKGMISDEDHNISFADFADENQLEKRLSSGDIHMISLRPGWEGIVVPSKFFGSLAAGRPIIYEGSENSSIRYWIERHGVGFYLSETNTEEIADRVCLLAEKPNTLKKKYSYSYKCYQENFSKKIIIDEWSRLLASI